MLEGNWFEEGLKRGRQVKLKRGGVLIHFQQKSRERLTHCKQKAFFVRID